MLHLVYYSNVSGNTARLVNKLPNPNTRLPLRPHEPAIHIHEPYVLITPTYGGGDLKTAVPKAVIRFLNDPDNRKHLVGVIATGNTNFGDHYALAGDIIATKCDVPVLARIEIFGTPEDITHIQTILNNLTPEPERT